MFSKLFKKRQGRYFLGKLAVTEKEDLNDRVSGGLFRKVDLEVELRERLANLIVLPKLESVDTLYPEDRALDIEISNYFKGETSDIRDLLFFILPLYFRPKIELTVRLFQANSDKTLGIVKVTEKMPFGEFFGKTNTINSLFRYKPLIEAEDMEALLCKACLKALKKLSLDSSR